MVTSKTGFHGPAFPDTRGTTQVVLFYPTLFNVVVDNVTRTWLATKVEDQKVAHDRLGETSGQCLGVFYADDGMLGS